MHSRFHDAHSGSQGKLKRMQDNDVDLEAGISKKKILMTGSSSQQESQAQPTSQQATGEKPSFRVIGHFVMAMKRFQGEQQYNILYKPLPFTMTPSPTCYPGACSVNQPDIHIRQSCRRQRSIKCKYFRLYPSRSKGLKGTPPHLHVSCAPAAQSQHCFCI